MHLAGTPRQARNPLYLPLDSKGQESESDGLFQCIVKLSDAIRLWFLLWHVIGFLPG
jgi:hypothetical protein